MALQRYTALAGARLHYDRFTTDQYGTEGAPFRPLIDTKFAEELDACFQEMNSVLRARLGVLEIVVSGGVARDGSGASLHHQNRAFDLDGLIFGDAHFVAADFTEEPQLYLAIEAVLRIHFGLVLAYDYNAAHQDHLHIDNSRPPGFRRDARSHTVFVQNLLYFVYDIGLLRDGVWGPETDSAQRLVREELDLGSLSQKTNWLTFCRLSAEKAAERVVAPPPRRVYA